MTAVRSKSPKWRRRGDRVRQALLAKVHIAKKESCMDDGLYRVILKNEFGVSSSAELNNGELASLVRRFESKGWVSKGRRAEGGEKELSAPGSQLSALKERIGQELLQMDFSPARFRGLLKKVCGVEQMEWCGDPDRLKRLLAVLGKIRAQINTDYHGWEKERPSR